ncbi:MAG TPA: PIN domain-containing protein, partial [Archaeoglobaceae archaeon]|nr:PIN domain-containing protein [Archaeoglobaceae archaeon]
MSVFVDTNVFVAYCNSRDMHHRKAIQLMERLDKGEFGDIYISDYVFNEIVTVTMLKAGIDKAAEIGEFLLNSVDMLRVDDEVFNDAWQIFKTAKVSFTDCTIVAMVKIWKIDNLMSFDKVFKRFEW